MIWFYLKSDLYIYQLKGVWDELKEGDSVRYITVVEKIGSSFFSFSFWQHFIFLLYFSCLSFHFVKKKNFNKNIFFTKKKSRELSLVGTLQVKGLQAPALYCQHWNQPWGRENHCNVGPLIPKPCSWLWPIVSKVTEKSRKTRTISPILAPTGVIHKCNQCPFGTMPWPETQINLIQIIRFFQALSNCSLTTFSTI